MGYWGYYPKQMTVAEIKAKGEKAVQLLQKKGRHPDPVLPISSRSVAQSWWGDAWCTNLERYADLGNRVERGKKYVRAGAVVDLSIEPEHVHALVVGSGAQLYKVSIDIASLTEKEKRAILDKCANRVESLEALVNGEFSEDLKSLFTAKGGLFPHRKQMHFHCSCPDAAYMCKHIAAALYGVGARLDKDPMLFFALRGIETDDLVEKVINNRLETMLKNADQPSERIMDVSSLQDVFGL